MPSYSQQGLDDFRGDHLSVRMFGAKGDTQATILATTGGSSIVTLVSGPAFVAPSPAVPGTPTTPAIPASTGDVGKRIIIYGAGSAGTPIHLVSDLVGSVPGTGALSVVLTIDSLGVGTKIGFAGNCSQNGITWQVFGSNSPVFAGEVSVYGPVALTPLAASDSYIETPPVFRYYRIKIVNTGGSTGVFFGTAVVWGHAFATTISAVVSSSQAALLAAPPATVSAAPAYYGTDDTAAIQAAIDTAAAMVIPAATADGGYNVYIPSGRYLISSPIFQKRCVTLKGQHGGGSIVYLDAVAFPINTPAWNMTGTFAADSAIAFFTRLQDVRIDCCHVIGSIGVFCDALQENSGLYRTTVINWTQYGIKASSAADQFGCTNWIIQDPWVYPSNSAFLDDTVRGIVGDFALETTIIRGTVLGQGGFICGFGKCLDFSHGILIVVGQLHVESARIGVHFNVGSLGSLGSLDTQSFVQNAVVIDAGNPVVINSLFSQGQNAIVDNIQNNTITQSQVPQYICCPVTLPTMLAAALQMTQGFPAAGPNVITLDPVNFGGDDQGGFIAVNSRFGIFPNWVKTTTNASNKAMFLRLAASAFEMMVGTANNANGTSPGTTYLRVDDAIGGARTPRLYFDTTLGLGAMEFGNNTGANRARWQHGGAGQTTLILQKTSNSGVSWQDVFGVDLVGGNIIFPNFSGFGSLVGSGVYWGSGSPNTVITAQPGSIYLDIIGALWYKQTGSGNTGWVQVVSGVTQLTGDVTAGPGSGSQASTITAGAVTLAKMANLPSLTVIGNNTGGAATPLALTVAQVTAILNTFTSVAQGLVSASGGGTTNFLRADGTWAAPPSGGFSASAWASYTPSTFNLTGVSTVAASNNFGKSCFVRAQVTGTSNGSNPTISLPFAVGSGAQTLTCIITQAGGGTVVGWVTLGGSTATIGIYNNAAFANGITYTITIQGVYETT